MSIAPILSWRNNKLKYAKYYLYLFLSLILLILILAFYTPFNIWGSIGIFTAIWVISSSLFSLKNKLILLKSKNYMTFLLNHNSILAHLGVGILILGITASSVFQKEYQKFINVNEYSFM